MGKKLESCMSAINAEAAANRRKEQSLESVIKNELEGTAVKKPGRPEKKVKKVKMNIMIYPEYKERLQAEADMRGISASHLIQMWIDENLD